MSKQKLIFLYLLFFISGIAGLLYQVMWMKELTLLLGGSTQSAAVTTMAFFLGLGLGASRIGLWVKFRKNKFALTFSDYMSYYALLEVAIAISALSYFAIYPLFNFVYSFLFNSVSGPLLVAIKLLLAIPLLSIPAFFMGGTLPIMAELVTDAQQQFAKRVSSIYFINTLGACAGAIAGGFWLPRLFGFNATYFTAIGLSLSLALIAFVMSKKVSEYIKTDSKASKSVSAKASAVQQDIAIPISIRLIAAWSGFASLALQVLWTRLFSQVMQNSTYTFSAILVVFLLCLAAGAFIANRLSKQKQSNYVLPTVFLASGFFTALTPIMYMQLTNNMSYIGGKADFSGYLFEVLGVVVLVIGPAVTIMGIALPFLYKLLQQQTGSQYAAVVGKVNSINTYAAIAGSAAAGFLLFQWLGTWQAIYTIALCYVLFALLLLASYKQRPATQTWWLVGISAVVVILLNPSHLPVVPVDPIAKKERLLEVWESSAGTVAVVEKDGNLKTKLNNWYALGGSKAEQMEAMQTHLPVTLHGKPESIFYLGLGTGITSGTSLNYPVKEVVIAELVKEVITASKRYFAPFTNDLFNDERVTVVNEDGRHYLTASEQQFDLIIADLFIPWRAGVGNLYALEHYQAALAKLNGDGLYVQWIPMYQVSENEFGSIAKTMQQAFEKVTVWRGDFFANKPVMALIGHKSAKPLTEHIAFRQLGRQALQQYKDKRQVPLFAHFVGQLTNELPLLKDKPVNTDNFSYIEYQAPMSHRAEKNGSLKWLTGPRLLQLMHELRGTQDEFLQGIQQAEINAIQAGYFLHAARIARELEDRKAEKQAMAQFNRLMR